MATRNVIQTAASATDPRRVFPKRLTPAPVQGLQSRLTKLVETMKEADRKIEMAYDAAEVGESVHTLLDCIGHDMLTGDALAIYKDAPTKADAEATYNALFAPLAALDGAIALSRGSVIEHTLREAWQLLDWAQTECDPTDIGRHLPAQSTTMAMADCSGGEHGAADTPAKPKTAHWLEVDIATGDLNAAEILLGIAHEECQFQYSDAEQSGHAQERLCVLLSAIGNEVADARGKLDAIIDVMRAES